MEYSIFQQDDNPNPYFRIALDVPEGQKMEFQTKTYHNTSSPIIDEDFCFQVSDRDNISILILVTSSTNRLLSTGDQCL